MPFEASLWENTERLACVEVFACDKWCSSYMQTYLENVVCAREEKKYYHVVNSYFESILNNFSYS